MTEWFVEDSRVQDVPLATESCTVRVHYSANGHSEWIECKIGVSTLIGTNAIVKGRCRLQCLETLGFVPDGTEGNCQLAQVPPHQIWERPEAAVLDAKPVRLAHWQKIANILKGPFHLLS